ncbi:MAG: caspase family protein [Bacteroidaceae bacterium]|nr:caspase family protein [Bacteroidaceae bacterium]
MKTKVILALLLSVIFVGLVSAQKKESVKEYRISSLEHCDKIQIGGKYLTKGNDFKETDVIDWDDNRQIMKAIPVGDIREYVFTKKSMKQKGADNLKTYFLRLASGSSRGADDIQYTKNPIPGQKRLALVIGNSNYLFQSPLMNPVSDADAVTEALLLKGFDVMEKTDMGISTLKSSVEHFNNLLINEGYDVALFYYAGHGIQVDYTNSNDSHDVIDYLVPVDAKLDAKSQIKNTCYRFNAIAEVLGNETRLQNIIIFDACRDVKNNFVRAASDGWRAPADLPNTHIFYSTKSGGYAFDGASIVSPFAKAFIEEIDKPGEEWLLVCQNISRNVEEITGQKGTLLGEVGRGFVFYPDTNKNKSEDSHSEQVKTKSVETAKQQNDIEKKSGSQDVAISQTTVTNSDTRVLPTTTNDNNVVAGHEFVDLGLSVKWATCNVGAEKPEDYGDYFAWGETSPKSDYTWLNLKYCTKSDLENLKFSKYVTKRKFGPVDNRTTLELSDDAARANWGGSWRMPTIAEFQELIDKCTWTWTTMNGKNGYKVVSKSNGNSIFLPAAGYRLAGTHLYSVGSYGDYWSGSLNESNSRIARGLYFDSDRLGTDYSYRYSGHSVRPVFR